MQAQAACKVALAITKLAFEGLIILKDFSAYICGDDDLAQLELKNQRLPLPVRPPEFCGFRFSQISLAIYQLVGDEGSFTHHYYQITTLFNTAVTS
jgi:hypothetical protein